MAASIGEEQAKRAKTHGPQKSFTSAALDYWGEKVDKQEPGMPPFSANKHPIVAMNLASEIITMIQDPDLISEMWSTKAKFFTKHPIAERIFKPMLFKHFVFYPTNEAWRTERKALSQMFYKEKLRIMIGVVKQHTELQYRKWIAEIEKNGEHRIDISEEFERINAHALNHICFGVDNNDDKFDFIVYDKYTDTFTERKVSFREAMGNMTAQAVTRVTKSLTHPVTSMAWLLAGVELRWHKIEDVVQENSKRLYKHIWKYVQDRKNGVTKSEMNNVDLLAVHLENPQTFSDEHVVGGILGALVAGIETSQYAMQTITTNLIKNKAIVGKLRKEFDEVVRKPAIAENADAAKLPTIDFLREYMHADQAFEMDYCNYVMQEGLRCGPPIGQGAWSVATQDVKVGKYQFKEGDIVSVGMDALGFNPAQW